MNKWTLKSLAAAALGVLALAGPANAAVSYSYVTDAHTGPTGTVDIQINPGQTKGVKLYLLETLSGGSPSLIAADGGLVGGAARIERSAAAPAGSSTLGTFTYNTTDFSGPSDDPSLPPPFTGNGVQTPTLVSFREAGPTAGAQPMPGNGGGNAANVKASAVFLGVLNIVAGQTGSVATFNLGRIDPTTINGSFDTITTNNSYDLDRASSAAPAYNGTGDPANATSFTVTVVPEPTFAGVAMVLGAAGTLIRRRRQQA